MGGLAGRIGARGADVVESMLEAIAHRGDRCERVDLGRCSVGVRSWSHASHGRLERGARDDVLAMVGHSIPAASARELLERIDSGDSSSVDGAFALVHWAPDTETLTLARDPFGKRSLYYAHVGDELYFATELKEFLEIPGFPIELDRVAVHTYLTFSFVPGDATPIANVRRLLPGHKLTFRNGAIHLATWFSLEERIAPVEQADAVRALRRMGREAVKARLDTSDAGANGVGLYLSGGLDSSAVGYWLRALGAKVTALSLDFGAQSVEREEATLVAKHLGLPLELVAVDTTKLASQAADILWKLDMPLGDAVTGPQWLLGERAKALGLTDVWNGEGGDQLFGGWTSKPMVAFAVYGGSHEDPDEATPEQQYLKSYHKFYGLETELYSEEFLRQVSPGIRRSIIAQFLGTGRAEMFLNRVRLTDLSLKGSQNILPRAERMGAAHGLRVRMPFFDRRLAEWSFTLPTNLKLRGACEKYILKLAMQDKLPEAIVWRRKFGMSVPITDWLLGPMKPLVEDLLSDDAVRRRGLFSVPFVRALREGKDIASETRKRRLGERLWALLVLEAWCRRFLDRQGMVRP